MVFCFPNVNWDLPAIHKIQNRHKLLLHVQTNKETQKLSAFPKNPANSWIGERSAIFSGLRHSFISDILTFQNPCCVLSRCVSRFISTLVSLQTRNSAPYLDLHTEIYTNPHSAPQTNREHHHCHICDSANLMDLVRFNSNTLKSNIRYLVLKSL